MDANDFVLAIAQQLYLHSDSLTASGESAGRTARSLFNNPQVRDLLLTLHCVYPELLLASLQLIDGGCLTRLSYETAGQNSGQPAEGFTKHQQNEQPLQGVQVSKKLDLYHGVFRVSRLKTKSAASHPSHGSSHQVNLLAWNCTCPAFAISALDHGLQQENAVLDATAEADAHVNVSKEQGSPVPIERSSPMCKHILACVLAQGCLPLDRSFVVKRALSAAEAAAQAAGWAV